MSWRTESFRHLEAAENLLEKDPVLATFHMCHALECAGKYRCRNELHLLEHEGGHRALSQAIGNRLKHYDESNEVRVLWNGLSNKFFGTDGLRNRALYGYYDKRSKVRKFPDEILTSPHVVRSIEQDLINTRKCIEQLCR